MAGGSMLVRLRARLTALRAPAARVVAAEQPVMLATLAAQPFSREGWLFEVKYDGVRILAERDGASIALYGRAGQSFTERYPEIVAALRALPLDRFILDGEVVALDERGRPSFQRLQARMHLTRAADIERARAVTPVTAVFFDALALDGRDLRALPLEARKELLALVVPSRGIVSYGTHVVAHGEAFYHAASERRVEGIVAKRTVSRYTGGRSHEWLKIKCHLRQEFVVGGYSAPQGSRTRFGSLHVGVYEGDALVYVGRVGTGFGDTTLEAIFRRLQPLRRPTSPFARGAPPGRGHTWVEPTLVCEVRFTEWTEEGGFRHPAFLGIRADKAPADCRREIAGLVPERAESRADERGAGLVVWKRERYTRGDLIAYYDAVAPLILPYLRDRRLVVTRFPDGLGGTSVDRNDVIHDANELRARIDRGAIAVHVSGSRARSPEHPDWLGLDLDPKGAPFAQVVRVAQALRRILDELEVSAYVKTSGATGLHVLVPLGARYTWDEARAFAQLLATLGVEAAPGKVVIDWRGNVNGHAIVAPFSVQALPGAPVSWPLRWDEVTARLDPVRFTIGTARKLLGARVRRGAADPMAPVLSQTVDIREALERLHRR